MPKQKLFDDDSDEDISLKTENEYAKKYDAWREKEEIHKLEQKYGSKAIDPEASSSDSEDESDEAPEVSEEMETQFLKTLALLKTKDPRIYDPSYKFFNESEDKSNEKKTENEDKPKTLTFADSDDDDDDDDPNIFTIEKKAETGAGESDTNGTKESKKTPKEGKLKDFLTGEAEHMEDEVEKDLEPLKAFWSDPKLNEGEAFLRDYILNKRYMEEDAEAEAGGAGDRLRDDAPLEADEALVEEQGQFERAYNFRFEEPDQIYLKRYPRTMSAVRPRDERRARRRAELRARKDAERQRKMDELARLKALKLKEVREKIEKLKRITGNRQLAFEDEDIEGEFDPEEHDRRMRAIFDESYYGEADERKPVFPDLDEELEIENWEKYEAEEYEDRNVGDEHAAPHCEDEDFNMDADYDPRQSRAALLQEVRGRSARRRGRRSQLARVLAAAPAPYTPGEHSSYARYMDEYYKMDCEDVIGGDLPTRFKYREVVPNDYGLSVEEILLADDKELTQWVPLKKIVKQRPAHVERGEVNTYRQKAADVNLKRKMLPSLFKDLPEEPEVVVPVDGDKKKKRKKKNKDQESDSNTNMEEPEQTVDNTCEEPTNIDETVDKIQKKNRKKKRISEDIKHKDDEIEISNKLKDKEVNSAEVSTNINADSLETLENSTMNHSSNEVKPFGKRKKTHSGTFVVESIGSVEPSPATDVTPPDNNETPAENKPAKQSKKRLNSESNVNDTEITAGPTKKKKRQIQNTISSENEHLHTKNNKDAKQKKNFNKNKNNKKDFKMKFKSKNKQGTDKPSHPFSNLSDERLKAYGLNPKKYKNFLKYKKF